MLFIAPGEIARCAATAAATLWPAMLFYFSQRHCAMRMTLLCRNYAFPFALLVLLAGTVTIAVTAV